MKAKTWTLGTVLLSVLVLAAVLGSAQAPVAPMGIIATPPDSELDVRIWVDKGAYAIGEAITINYSVNKPAYVYIWDIQPDGVANQLFPYPSSGSPNNFVQAGDHTLAPPPGSSGWVVAPPTGTEYLQILATTSPVQPFAYMTPDPQAFQQSIEAQILGVLPADQRSWGFTSFEIVSESPPTYGRVTVNSTPGGALIRIDGEYAGYTPRTMFVEEGFHRFSVSKSGYQEWNAAVFVIGGLTRTIHVDLQSLAPSNTPPTALFSASPSTPAVGEWVQFDASGSVDPDGTIATYSWDFGNGSTASGSSAWQRFTSAGSYTVTLIVTDDDGASDSVSQTLRVGPTNQPPTASFTFSPNNPDVNAWVQFDGSGSSDADGSIVSTSWDFGDGSSDTGQVAWHRFSSSGTYVVTLTVRDDDGATNSTTRTVQVGSSNRPPTAAFTLSPSSPNASEWVRFDGTGSSDPDGSIESYSWSFDDGTAPVSGDVAYHRFPSPGSYLVTLTVRDDEGASDSTSRTVQIGGGGQPPVAAFTFSPQAPVVGQAIGLNAQSSYDPDGSVVSYLWDLDGDGSNDMTGAVGQVTYQNTGTVSVRLTVVDNDGLSSSTTRTITVSGGGATPGGRPPMGTTAGFFVWGSDRWHVTVNAGAGWSIPHDYRIELRTDGTFQEVNQTSDTGSGSAAPMGIVPTPTQSGKTLIYEGSLQTGSIDHNFRIPDSESMWLQLQLDLDGDGRLETSTGFVYLRSTRVNPPTSPFVVGLPSGSTAELTPSLNFRIGNAISYTATTRFVYWTTTISNLENR